MKMLGIYNSKNKRFRRDGNEFRREALKWAKAQPFTPSTKWGMSPSVRLVDIQDGRIRREIRSMRDGLDVLAVFDHGVPKGLPRMRENLGCVKGLAATIAGVTNKITIILYSCSTGRGWWGPWGFRRWNKKNKIDIDVQADSYNPRDGYAVALACELAKLGVDAEVFAHLTAGHCCRNPHVAMVKPFGKHGTRVTRERWVKPRAPGWKKWRRDLKGPARFTFWV